MAEMLEHAFMTTRYRIDHAGDLWTLRVGEPCPAPLTDWVHRYAGSRPAWLITGCNPGADALATARNRGRIQLVRLWAAECASAWLPSVNEAANGAWPDEPGVLAAGVEEGLVRSMGRRLGQLAVVTVSASGPVSLLWLKNPSA